MKFSEECRSAAAEWWEGSFVHPFVQGIGDGTLPIDRFKYYVLQDSYYLTHFARCNRLAPLMRRTFIQRDGWQATPKVHMRQKWRFMRVCGAVGNQ